MGRVIAEHTSRRPTRIAAPERTPLAVIIEDDPDLQELVRLVIQPRGWAVAVASTVAEGLAAARSLDPDVVVLDLGLPDRPGLDVVAELQGDDRTSWIPIVVLSGDARPDTATNALHAGAQDFITKPFAFDELHARLVAALRVATAHRAVLAAEEQFRQTFEEAPIGIALVGLDGTWLRVNRALCRSLGYSSEELQQRTFRDVTHPDDLDSDLVLVDQLRRGEIERYQLDKRYLHADGRAVWAQLNVSLVRDELGEPVHYVSQIQDVTDLYDARELLTHRSLHDPLTGLPNRVLMLDRLRHALAGRGDGFALFFVDLDRFKVVNDSLGHEAGDALLVEVAARLCRCVRDADTVARLGGDEFIVLAEGIDDVEGAALLGERIRRSIARPHQLESGEVVVCTASIGISLPVNGLAPEELLREADTAMYRAKERGKDRAEVFDDALRVRAVERLRTEQVLRRALDADGIVVRYQPVIDLASGQIVGAEALARLRDGDDLLVPAAFLDVATDSGLVTAIGERVLAHAVHTAQLMRARHGDGFSCMAVNVAARQLDSPGFIEHVARSLGTAELDPAVLCLELTEHSLIEATRSSHHSLTTLKELGLRLAIDDFGTGYSSLSYLRMYPIDLVKIDRSFVDGTPGDADDTSIVNAVISLCHSLSLEVVAEGVETEAQLAHLRSRGCNGAQGFLMAAPMEAEELDALLATAPSW